MTPQEARKLWTDALRSGEYQQTKGVLCNIDKNAYCCLGVACEVYQKHVGDLEIREDQMTTSEYIDGQYIPKEEKIRTFDHARGFLPPKVSEWLDMSSNGTYDMGVSESGYPKYTTLTSQNDIANKNFNEIADLIETKTFAKPNGLQY